MTISNPSIDFHHIDDASFRAWGSAIGTALTALGLVKTADTGQINWATVLRPGVSTNAGYEIWRFNDTLQATKPVFIKLEYTTESGGATSLGVWLTTGVRTDGVGNITLGVSTRSIILSAPSVTAPIPCYFSSDGSSLAWYIPQSALGSAGTSSMVIIERTRNADGTPNGDGLLHFMAPTAGLFYVGTTDFSVPLHTQISSGSSMSSIPVPAQLTSGNYQGDTWVWPFYVFLPKAEAPSKMVLAVFKTDITPFGTTFTTTHLGSVHTYITFGPNTQSISANAGCGAALLWE